MIKFDDAKLALAEALYNLLAVSDVQEWFSVAQIAQKSGLSMGGALVNRVLTLSQEEEELFSSSADDGEVYWTLGREGFELVESNRDIGSRLIEGTVPASDRVVRFNHNSPDAQEISSRLDEVREAVRGINSPEVEELERQRITDALALASQLWNFSQFKIVQFKVTILMAAEDALALLTATGKAMTAGLLVDALKAFAKRHFHTDLDSL